ncbi:hypothetical protein J5U22_01180 [Saccharolobus shibatae]|uniref:Uncharacterized protein n=1 Tax=Saccharolobus shibatae TaxID=2286 RepID=A0A8F5GYT3_9CREN|nr:hypothetical protein J5U22_01180 [Saccharolobus shibatae]
MGKISDMSRENRLISISLLKNFILSEGNGWKKQFVYDG